MINAKIKEALDKRIEDFVQMVFRLPDVAPRSNFIRKKILRGAVNRDEDSYARAFNYLEDYKREDFSAVPPTWEDEWEFGWIHEVSNRMVYLHNAFQDPKKWYEEEYGGQEASALSRDDEKEISNYIEQKIRKSLLKLMVPEKTSIGPVFGEKKHDDKLPPSASTSDVPSSSRSSSGNNTNQTQIKRLTPEERKNLEEMLTHFPEEERKIRMDYLNQLPKDAQYKGTIIKFQNYLVEENARLKEALKEAQKTQSSVEFSRAQKTNKRLQKKELKHDDIQAIFDKLEDDSKKGLDLLDSIGTRSARMNEELQRLQRANKYLRKELKDRDADKALIEKLENELREARKPQRNTALEAAQAENQDLQRQIEKYKQDRELISRLEAELKSERAYSRDFETRDVGKTEELRRAQEEHTHLQSQVLNYEKEKEVRLREHERQLLEQKKHFEEIIDKQKADMQEALENKELKYQTELDRVRQDLDNKELKYQTELDRVRQDLRMERANHEADVLKQRALQDELNRAQQDLAKNAHVLLIAQQNLTTEQAAHGVTQQDLVTRTRERDQAIQERDQALLRARASADALEYQKGLYLTKSAEADKLGRMYYSTYEELGASRREHIITKQKLDQLIYENNNLRRR